jgi:hypothetical protein
MLVFRKIRRLGLTRQSQPGAQELWGNPFPKAFYYLSDRLMGIWVFLQKQAQQAREQLRGGIMAHPRRLAAAVLVPLALGILFACVQPAMAAVQLNFFNVIAFPSSVTLEWSTSSEVNLAGFDIQCKQANEPDTAFHAIGFARAQGGPNVGALYSFPVTSGVVPGVSYCFRLKEITTDGSAGEVFDRCGYGPMVTPTPGLGAIPVFTPVPVPVDAFGNPIPPTPTPVVVATDAFGNPVQQFPQAVATDAFGNPIQQVPQAVATDAFGNPIPFNPISPLATPFPAPVATDAFGNPIQQVPPAVATDAFGNPIPTPIPQPAPFDPNSPLPTPDPFAAASSAALDAYGNPLPDPMANEAQASLDTAPEYAQPATPTVAYVIVTATPTQVPVALAPVLTPLPTATPVPAGVQLASSLQPGGQNLTQNLMIMLLCLTFTGATGIGIIGLITSVMFMRARSSQRDFYERTSIRRRY